MQHTTPRKVFVPCRGLSNHKDHRPSPLLLFCLFP
nr:MAG TPA: hypothetical protein [Bacteriophage sp.]